MPLCREATQKLSSASMRPSQATVRKPASEPSRRPQWYGLQETFRGRKGAAAFAPLRSF
jgi:hypothetical protein